MILAMLCSFALQSTPGSPTVSSPGAGPVRPSNPVTGASDFFIGKHAQEGVAASRPQDDFFLGQGQARALVEAGRQDAVTRTYDVRALGLGAHGREREVPGLRLLPSVDVIGQSTAVGGSGPGLVDEGWVNLLVDLLGRTAQGEGRNVVVAPGGQLIVTGPAPMHQSVEGLLALLGGAASQEVRLTLDVLRRNTTDVEGLAGTLMTLSEADALAAGAAERFELTLRDDGDGVLEATHHISALFDYDVQVASGAASLDPLVVRCALGTRLLARAAPAVGGVHLAFVVKRGDLQLARRAQGIDMSTRHVGEDGRALTQVCATLIEDPTWTSASFASSCFLPADRALVLLGSSEPGVTEVLLIRCSADKGAGAPRLVSFDDGSGAAMVHLGAFVPPELLGEGSAFAPGFGDVSYRTAHGLLGDDLAFLACGFAGSGWNATRDGLLRGLGRGFDHWEVGPWIVVRGESRALAGLGGPPPAAAANLTIDLRMEQGETTLRSARVPVRLGSGAAVALTWEQLDAVDYDVEIAERSACTDLNMQHVFDGLACWVRVLPVGDGRIVLETAGAAQVAGPRRNKMLQDSMVNMLEERDVELLGLRARQTLTRGAAGEYRAVLGAQGGDSLRVVIELH